MNTIKNFYTYTTFLTALLVASGMLLSYHASAEVVIIANPSIGDNSIAANEIGKVFLGKIRKLASGSKIKPVTLKSGTPHDEFLSNYVHKTSSQFSAFWKKKIVDGTGIPPKSFSSEQDMVNYIKSHENAIGYVSTNVDTSGLKILTINE